MLGGCPKADELRTIPKRGHFKLRRSLSQVLPATAHSEHHFAATQHSLVVRRDDPKIFADNFKKPQKNGQNQPNTAGEAPSVTERHPV
jgi:hypothetical protein